MEKEIEADILAEAAAFDAARNAVPPRLDDEREIRRGRVTLRHIAAGACLRIAALEIQRDKYRAALELIAAPSNAYDVSAAIARTALDRVNPNPYPHGRYHETEGA